MIDVVIFDLFGTLIHLPHDTNPYLQLCRATGNFKLIRESLVVDAPTLADFCDRLGVAHPSNLADIQRDLESDIDSAAKYPDAMATLCSIREKGLRVALISNLASPYKLAVAQLDLESYFDATLYSCDLGIAKPHPQIYNAALSQLNATSTSTLMVGDSQRCDVDGPMSCGILGLLIDRDGKTSDDTVLRSLTDIMSLLSS